MIKAKIEWLKPKNLNVIGRNGAQGRIRTTDTRIFSPLLYQLSYLGTPQMMRVHPCEAAAL
jgi:hypothetical protein